MRPAEHGTGQSPAGAERAPRLDEHGGDTVAHPGVRLDFSISVNPLGTPPEVRQAITSHLDDIAAYPDPQCRALRDALGQAHRVAPTRIVCGNGASDVIHRVTAALRPRRVLVASPTFSEYERSARVCGAEVLHHRLAAPDFDATDALLYAVSGDVDMVFCCQPNNPTGRLVDPGLLSRLVERTREVGAVLVVDECFLPFTEAPSSIPGLAPHVVVVRAFTKTHGLAGLRLGYAVCGDEATATAMTEQGARWNVSSLAQAAGIAALACEGWDERTRAVVRDERDYLTTSLTELGLQVVPSQANFLLLRSDADLFGPLLAHGVLIRSCANFSGLDASYGRVGLKSHADNIQLVDALRKVLLYDR